MKLRIEKRGEVLAPVTAELAFDVRNLATGASCTGATFCCSCTCGMAVPTPLSRVEKA